MMPKPFATLWIQNGPEFDRFIGQPQYGKYMGHLTFDVRLHKDNAYLKPGELPFVREGDHVNNEGSPKNRIFLYGKITEGGIISLRNAGICRENKAPCYFIADYDFVTKTGPIHFGFKSFFHYPGFG